MANYSNLQQIGNLQRFYQPIYMQSTNNLSSSIIEQKCSENRIETRVGVSQQDVFEQQVMVYKKQQPFADPQFDTSFFKEHVFMFKKYLVKFKQLFVNNQQSNLMEDQQDILQLQNMNQISFSSFLKSHQQTRSQLQTFCQEVYNNQKLFQFIEIIINLVSRQISSKLIKIIQILYVCLADGERVKLNEKEIIERVAQKVNSTVLSKIKNIIISHIKVQPKEINSKIALFTIFLSNTILFIMGEYFVNPYYQLEEELIIKEYQHYQLLLYDSSFYEQESNQDYERINGRKRVKMQDY